MQYLQTRVQFQSSGPKAAIMNITHHFLPHARTALFGVLLVFLALPQAVAQDSGQQAPQEHPLKAAIRIATQARDQARQLTDYQALFTKAEVVRGRMFSSQMQMKFRTQPMSVYLNFVNQEHAGREVIYVEGQNNGMMLAHETGLKALAGTVPVDPEGELARSEARHPITQIGMANLAEGVILQWEKESAFGESEVKYYAEAKLAERDVLVIESSHPQRRNQFPYAITRLWIDKETKLPVRLQNYEFPHAPDGKPVLVEDYTYTNIQTNVGLKPIDFDVRNPAYKF